MKPKLAPHIIPQHFAQLDRDMLREWKPKSIKDIWVGMPAYMDFIVTLNPDFIIFRDYEIADKGQEGIVNVEQAVKRGKEHASKHFVVAEELERTFNWPRRKVLFEGWNEPPIWGERKPEIVDAYESARIDDVDKWNGRVIVCNLNTGHPDNSGPDTDPNWFWFPQIKRRLEVRKGVHGLGIHEYMCFMGPEEKRPQVQPDGTIKLVGGWTWDMGRYTRNHWDCDIYITECGVDNAVQTGQHSGWQNLTSDMSRSAHTYTNWLLWYAAQLAKDVRIKGAYIFTHDSQSHDWLSFDTRNDTFRRIFIPAYQNTDFPEPEQPPEEDLIWTDISSQLPHNTHLAPYTERELDTINTVVIHHTAAAPELTATQIARYHISPPSPEEPDKEEHPSIAYHFYIVPDGTIYRTQPDRVITWHAGVWSYNVRSIAICFAGDFTQYDPTYEQVASGQKLVNYLAERYELRREDVIPHSDITDTVCPGEWWTILLQDIGDEEPVTGVEHAVRQRAWNYRSIPLNEGSAFYKKASELHLGCPISRENDMEVEGEWYRWQGFANGLLWCIIYKDEQGNVTGGDWANIQEGSW